MHRQGHRNNKLSMSIVILLFGVLWGSLCTGDEPGKGHRDLKDSFPSPQSSANLVFEAPSFERRLHIHREDPTFGRPHYYYHRPVLAFSVNPNPITGYPAIVMDVDDSGAEGNVFLEFVVLTSSPAVRTSCRDAVLAQDREYAFSGGATEDDIRVASWPLKHAVIECRTSLARSVLSLDETDSLSAVADSMRFVMKFTSEDLARFLSAASRGRVDFVFSYSYTGRTVQQGSTTITGSKSLVHVVESVLSSEQITGESPILQGNRSELSRAANTHIRTVTRLQHPDLLPMLQTSDVLRAILDPGKWLSSTELAAQFEGVESQLVEYLKPRLRKIKDAVSTEDNRVVLHEDEDTTIGKAGFGVDAAIKFEGGIEFKDRALDRITETTGVTYEQLEDTEWYVPHRIQVHRLLETWDRAVFDEESIVYLAVGRASNYLIDSPVKMIFTVVHVVDAVQQHAREQAYTGVRLGSIIPYFGAGEQPPNGYVWADGVATWPNAPWVPEALIGTRVPNMNNSRYLAGASSEAEVGTFWNNGRIPYPDTVVRSKWFSIADGPVSVLSKKVGSKHAYGVVRFNRNGENWVEHVYREIPQRSGVKPETKKRRIDRVPEIREARGLKLSVGSGDGTKHVVKHKALKATRSTMSPHYRVRYIIRVQ